MALADTIGACGTFLNLPEGAGTAQAAEIKRIYQAKEWLKTGDAPTAATLGSMAL